MKKAVVSVINDLVTDQRVDKTCKVLEELNYEVLLVGRKKRKSPPLGIRSYKQHRMRLIFEKGPLFYAEFNIRLFLLLLFRKTDLLFANDLDTLLANFLVHKIKGPKLIYDSHELFTETPEVIHRKFVQRVWLSIESSIFPKLKEAITVSDSIAQIFREKYGIPVTVVRNIPPNRNIPHTNSRKDLGIDLYKRVLIMQGAGINIQRGAEELIEAMQFVSDTLLLIIGGGDVIQELKKLCTSLSLDECIRFIPRVPVEELYQYTMCADLGLSLDKDTNLNYRYSLPNKLFDYIHAGIPILASPLVEVGKIVEGYSIGSTIDSHDPKHIAEKIEISLSDGKQYKKWKENLKFAASELNWSVEKQKLKSVLKRYA